MKKSPKPTKRPARPALLQGDSTFVRLMLQIDGTNPNVRMLENDTAIAERMLAAAEPQGFDHDNSEGMCALNEVSRQLRGEWSKRSETEKLADAILAANLDVVSGRSEDIYELIISACIHSRNIGAGLMYGLMKTQAGGR